ncbi:MAG TPA: hypothetical protein VFM38_07470, partial [Candidatus Limnocylindrales bacterium]|nr:hypothetical protein [Candidatus Limnocylindrales bacterium]
GTQFDPELVELFCDLYADHAPEPDPTFLAMGAAGHAHGNGPLIMHDAAAPRPARRRRTNGSVAGGPVNGSGGESTGAADGASSLAESRTMAPDATLGLVPPATQVVPTFPSAPPSSPSSTSRGRRSDSATG